VQVPERQVNVGARVRLTLAAVLGLVALALGGVLLLGGDGGRGSDGLDVVNGFAGAQRAAEIPPATFALRDQDGRSVKATDTRGHVTVLTFMYSTCRDSCPVIASQIRGALDDVGRDVPVLAISVDPRNDTPLSARRFVNRQSLTGRMRFLLGSRTQLAPVWREFAIKPQGKGFEHSAYVVLLDRDGRQRIAFPFDKLTPEGLAHDIRALGG
jgi:protein SCO1/2